MQITHLTSKFYPVFFLQDLFNNLLLLFSITITVHYHRAHSPITIPALTITTSKLFSFEVYFIDLRIHKKPIPTTLQKMPDKLFNDKEAGKGQNSRLYIFYGFFILEKTFCSKLRCLLFNAFFCVLVNSDGW